MTDKEKREFSLMALRQKQGLPLEMKEVLSIKRIEDWIEHWRGDVYVSFSGGKDSTVLLDLVRRVRKYVPAVFVDTGLEYPEIREFVKTVENVTWVKPKMTFRQVIEKYGYPFPSKEQSYYIEQARNTKSDYLRDMRVNGKIMSDGSRSNRFKISKKWLFLLHSPYKVSSKCCDFLKKEPLLKTVCFMMFHPGPCRWHSIFPLLPLLIQN